MPGLFGGSKYLAKYPFALPNLLSAVIFLIGITVGALFLRETLETRRKSRDYGRIIGKKLIGLFKPKKTKQSRRHEVYGEVDARTPLLSPRPSSSQSSEMEYGTSSPSISKIAEKPPSIKEVFSRQSAINLAVYTFLALHSVSFDQLLVIFMHLPKQVPNESNTSFPFKFSGGK